MMHPYPNDVEWITRQRQLPAHATYNKGVIFYDEKTRTYYVVNNTDYGNEERVLDFATKSWQQVEEHIEEFEWELVNESN